MPKPERIKTLYRVIWGVPENKFGLFSWRDGANTPMGYLVADDLLLHQCGTTACAGGWAAAYPPFKDQGLYYFYGGLWYRERGSYWDGFDALEKFFGLTAQQADRLFSPAVGHTTKWHFLEALREFMFQQGIIDASMNELLCVHEHIKVMP